MDPGEAELEHESRRLAELLEDLRRRARGERGRQPAHSSRSTVIAQAAERGGAERERRGHERRPVEEGRRLPDSDEAHEGDEAALTE